MDKEHQQVDLETLLSGEDGDTPAEPIQEHREPEAKGETPPEPPSEEPASEASEPDGPLVPRQGLIDERKKRQGLEQTVADLQKKLDELSSQPRQPQQNQSQDAYQPPDFYEDPDAYVQRAMFETRASLSQEMMRERHQDYDEVEQVFYDAAQQNPSLVQGMMKSPNPAKYAYDMGRKFKLMNQIGDDPSAYEAGLEAKFREKYGISEEGQPAQVPQQPQNPNARAPTSLASVPSAKAQPRDSKGRYAPAPLEQIFNE